MDTVIDLLNEKYKGWSFCGMEKVVGSYKGIAHPKHNGDFLMLHFEKEGKNEKILICEGEENFLNIFPFEQTKRLLTKTKYSSCENEDSESLNDFCLQYLNESDESEDEENRSDESEYTCTSVSSDESE